MKTKKLTKKVLRYLELSQEFEQKEKELFNEVTNSGCASFSHTDSNIQWAAPQGICITRGERIMYEAQLEKDRSDRYDEYKFLQRELGDYFNALKNIES